MGKVHSKFPLIHRLGFGAFRPASVRVYEMVVCLIFALRTRRVKLPRLGIMSLRARRASEGQMMQPGRIIGKRRAWGGNPMILGKSSEPGWVSLHRRSKVVSTLRVPFLKWPSQLGLTIFLIVPIGKRRVRGVATP